MVFRFTNGTQERLTKVLLQSIFPLNSEMRTTMSKSIIKQNYLKSPGSFSSQKYPQPTFGGTDLFRCSVGSTEALVHYYDWFDWLEDSGSIFAAAKVWGWIPNKARIPCSVERKTRRCKSGRIELCCSKQKNRISVATPLVQSTVSSQ